MGRSEPPSFGTWRRRFLAGLPGENDTDDADYEEHAQEFSHLMLLRRWSSSDYRPLFRFRTAPNAALRKAIILETTTSRIANRPPVGLDAIRPILTETSVWQSASLHHAISERTMYFCRHWSCIAPMWALVLALAFTETAAGQEPQWVAISDAAVAKVASDTKKAASFERETAGVAVDPMSGDVYMIVNKHGVWKSSDGGKTFARSDGATVSGRCETAFSLNVDPAGQRLACFMLDGQCAWTGDGGTTWRAMANVGRNWDFAAVDWSTADVKNIFAGLHESGGQVLASIDGGRSWKKLFKDREFDKTGG